VNRANLDLPNVHRKPKYGCLSSFVKRTEKPLFFYFKQKNSNSETCVPSFVYLSIFTLKFRFSETLTQYYYCIHLHVNRTYTRLYYRVIFTNI
jgi:hypothetical protein